MLALVVNRASDTHRWQLFQQAFAGSGLSYERFDAVNGFSVPDWLSSYYHSNLSAGQTGCSASHHVAAKRLLDSAELFALILEDDARPLAPGLSAALDDIIANLPSTWDIVRLVRSSRRPKHVVRRLSGNRSLVQYLHIPYGTAAYVMSRSGAAKLLKPRTITLPIDKELRRPWDFGLRVLGVEPPLFGEADHAALPSTIDPGPPHPSPPVERLQRLVFNWRELGTLNYLKAAIFNR